MLLHVLLAIAVGLIIPLRKGLRRLEPLRQELSVKNVVIDQIHTGVAWVRKDGTLGWLNAALAESLQISPQDLIGKEWYELFDMDERARIREDYRQMLFIGKLSLNTRGLRADGNVTHFEVALVPVKDRRQRYAGHHCLVSDLTLRRELEQELEQLNTQESAAMEVACVGGR
jgi:PAS domain S-box-containing protein